MNSRKKMGVTIITALVDIGNYKDGIEGKFGQRNFFHYLSWLKEILTIKANFCIFIHDQYRDEIENFRSSNSFKTKVYSYSRKDIENKFYYPIIENIIRKKLPVRRPERPEMVNPLYNSMVFSKVKLVNAIAQENPFGSKYFMWLDAGFGHGISNTKYSWVQNTKWPNEEKLKNIGEKIIINQIRPFKYDDKNNLLNLYRNHITKISGGIWCGQSNEIKVYHDLFIDIIKSSLANNIMDDDQSIMYECYLNNPELFHPFKGYNIISRDWHKLMAYLK